jgi:hypothetical protein
MDVHCSSCGEPWDTDHLLHDAIHDTFLSQGEIVLWRQLSPSEKLATSYRLEFKGVGWDFGRTLLHVVRCPSCGPDSRPDPEVATLKGAIEEILGDDLEPIAAEFLDHHL